MQRSTRARGKGPPAAVEKDPLEGTVMHAVMATSDIKAGDEILISYGEDYWSCRPNLIRIPCKEHQKRDSAARTMIHPDDNEDDASQDS